MSIRMANLVFSQLGWFACVLSAARGLPWVGVAFVVLWIAVHLALRPPLARRREAALLALAGVVGYLSDSALVLAGIMSFPEPARLLGPSPLWMVALWLNFAATLNHAMRWLGRSLPLACALGALGGPMAYLAGERLSAITLPTGSAWASGWIAAQWALATPALVWFAQRPPIARAQIDAAPEPSP